MSFILQTQNPSEVYEPIGVYETGPTDSVTVLFLESVTKRSFMTVYRDDIMVKGPLKLQKYGWTTGSISSITAQPRSDLLDMVIVHENGSSRDVYLINDYDPSPVTYGMPFLVKVVYQKRTSSTDFDMHKLEQHKAYFPFDANRIAWFGKDDLFKSDVFQATPVDDCISFATELQIPALFDDTWQKTQSKGITEDISFLYKGSVSLSEVPQGLYLLSDFAVDVTQSTYHNQNPCYIRVQSLFDTTTTLIYNLLSNVLPIEKELALNLQFDTCPNGSESTFTYEELQLKTITATYVLGGPGQRIVDQTKLLTYSDSAGGSDVMQVTAQYEEFSNSLGLYSVDYKIGFVQEPLEELLLLPEKKVSFYLTQYCTITLPTFQTNSVLYDTFTYVRSYPPLVYTLQGWSADCDVTREFFKINGDPHVNTSKVTITQSQTQDTLAYQDNEIVADLLNSHFTFRITSVKDSSVFQEMSLPISLLVSTCTQIWSSPTLADVSYVGGDPELIISFDQQDINDCPFKLEITDVTDPGNTATPNPLIFTLTQPVLTSNPSDPSDKMLVSVASSGTLKILTGYSDETVYGLYKLRLDVVSQRYPAETQMQSQEFSVTIEPCIVVSANSETTLTKTVYKLGEPLITIASVDSLNAGCPYSTFTIVPSVASLGASITEAFNSVARQQQVYLQQSDLEILQPGNYQFEIIETDTRTGFTAKTNVPYEVISFDTEPELEESEDTVVPDSEVNANSTPYFDPQKVYEVQRGSIVSVTLDPAFDTNQTDTVKVILTNEQTQQMSFDERNQSLTIMATNSTKLGLLRVKVTVGDSKDQVDYFINFWVNDYALDRERLPQDLDEKQIIVEPEQDETTQNQQQDAEIPEFKEEEIDPIVKKLKKRIQESQVESLREYKQDDLDLLEPPLASIRSINQIGEVRVVFSQEMQMIDEFAQLEFSSATTRRKLANQENDVQDQVSKIPSDTESVDLASLIQAQVLKGDEDTSAEFENMHFEFILVEFTSQSMLLKFKYEHPLSISIGDRPDILKITFVEPEVFVSKETFKALRNDTHLEKEIPKQFPDGTSYELAVVASSTVQVAANTAFLSQLGVTICLAVSLKSMWNLMHVMQVMAYLRLLVELPANSNLMLQSMHNAITLENLINSFYQSFQFDLKSLTADYEGEQQLKESEFNYGNLWISLGIFGICLAVLVSGLLLYVFIALLCRKCKFCDKFRLLLKSKLVYSVWIRYLIESNLKTTHSCVFFLALEASYSTTVEWTTAAIRIVILIVIVIWPFFLTSFLYLKRAKINNDLFQSKFISMYTGLKTKQFVTLIYTAIFCIRRLLLVLTLLVLKENQFWLLIAFHAIQSLYFWYICLTVPHDAHIHNRLEYLNEFCLIVMQHLLIFSIHGINADPYAQWDIGIATMCVTAFVFVVNLAALVYLSIKKLCFWLKVRKIKTQHFGKVQKGNFSNAIVPIEQFEANRLNMAQDMSSIVENRSESESSIRLPASRLLQLHSDTSQQDLTDPYAQEMTLQNKPISSLGLVLKQSEKAKRSSLQIEEESPRQNHQKFLDVKLPPCSQKDHYSNAYDFQSSQKKLQRIATAVMSRANTGLGIESLLSDEAEPNNQNNCQKIHQTEHEQSIQQSNNDNQIVEPTDQSFQQRERDSVDSEHTIIDYRAETQRDDEAAHMQKIANDQLLYASQFMNAPEQEFEAPPNFDQPYRPPKESSESSTPPAYQQKENQQIKINTHQKRRKVRQQKDRGILTDEKPVKLQNRGNHKQKVTAIFPDTFIYDRPINKVQKNKDHASLMQSLRKNRTTALDSSQSQPAKSKKKQSLKLLRYRTHFEITAETPISINLTNVRDVRDVSQDESFQSSRHIQMDSPESRHIRPLYSVQSQFSHYNQMNLNRSTVNNPPNRAASRHSSVSSFQSAGRSVINNRIQRYQSNMNRVGRESSISMNPRQSFHVL